MPQDRRSAPKARSSTVQGEIGACGRPRERRLGQAIRESGRREPGLPASSRPRRGGKTTVTKGGLFRTVIFLSPEERRALKQAALDREMPASEVVREALRAFLGIKE